MDAGLVSLRCKRVAALNRRSRKENHCKEFGWSTEEFNLRSALARDAFLQTKISHALESSRNGVWRELRNLGLLPKQQELLGIEPDSLNSHFDSVSATDARVREKYSEVILQAREDGFRFFAVSPNDFVFTWRLVIFRRKEEAVMAFHSWWSLGLCPFCLRTWRKSLMPL